MDQPAGVFDQPKDDVEVFDEADFVHGTNLGHLEEMCDVRPKMYDVEFEN
jgi:hypothetical protein